MNALLQLQMLHSCIHRITDYSNKYRYRIYSYLIYSAANRLFFRTVRVKKIGGWWLAMKKVSYLLIFCRAPHNRLKSMRAGSYVYRPCISLRCSDTWIPQGNGNFVKSYRMYVKLSHINFHLKFFGIKQCWEPGSIILQGQWLKKKKCGITSRVLDDLFLVLLVDQLLSSQAAQ